MKTTKRTRRTVDVTVVARDYIPGGKALCKLSCGHIALYRWTWDRQYRKGDKARCRMCAQEKNS